MSKLSNAVSRHSLSVDPTPLQIPRDMQASDNPPLSPQWLLPKPGDQKEMSSPHGTKPNTLKLSGNGDDLHSAGKKEAFRPSFHDIESGRRDRWHEEERETNSIRRDRWRDGDKEPNEIRKMDLWSEASSKHSGEALRRAVPERKNDSGNKDGDHRKESKWSTRWGPDDKESGSWREKWSDSNRDGDGSHDKGTTPFSTGKETNNHSKEAEKEDYYSRPWKAYNSSARGRADSINHQSQVPSKQPALFGHGRGKTESTTSVLAAGRGRFSSGTNVGSGSIARPYHLGGSNDKSDDPSIIKYNRMKLLDIYRSTDIKSYNHLLEGLAEVPSLTQNDPLEPLALSALTSDESAILKGIDKGDIVSSGAPQVSKDGSVGRTTADAASSRHIKSGSSEESLTVGNVHKDASICNIEGKDGTPPGGINGTPTRGVARQDSTSYVPRRTQSTEDHIRGSSHDWKGFSIEAGSREIDSSRFHFQNDLESDHKIDTSTTSSSYKEVDNWLNVGLGFHSNAKIKHHSSQATEESKVNIMPRHENSFSSRETSSSSRSLLPQTSPEDLSLYYRDPQGQIQGPFSGSDLIGWFEAGYFGIDLPVKLANSPVDVPFSLLGDVMPHLRMKARPPPGFKVANQSDTLEETLRLELASSSTVHQGFSDFEVHNNGQNSAHDPTIEAQNRLLESLMSSNVQNSSSSENFSFSKGMQGYGGNGSGFVSSLGGESGNNMNYLLAQTRLMERQRSITSSLPLWPNNVSSLMPKSDSMPGSSTLQSQPISTSSDANHQSFESPEHIDVMSLLQSAADKAQPPAVNSGVSLWSNFNDARALSNNNIHGGIELKDALGVHHNQHVAPHITFGMQQVMQQPSRSPLSHFGSQSGDLSSGFVVPEKLIASDISQDPRVLSLLQQQYLLSQLQMHSHDPVSTQLSPLDKILVLQQQLKQEQQQQHHILMQQQQQQILLQQQQQHMLMQQQQHLLSQVLSGHQPHQHFSDSSYGIDLTTMSAGNVPAEQLGSQRMHEGVINQQMAFSKSETSQAPHLPIPHVGNNQLSVDSGSSPVNLPHTIFNQMEHSKTSVASLLPDEDELLKSSVHETTMLDSLSTSYDINNSEQDNPDVMNNRQYLENVENKNPSNSQTSQMPSSFITDMQQNLEPVEDPVFVPSISNHVQHMKISAEKLSELPKSESTSNEQVIIVETLDVKKTPEKKSRKQKKPKAETPSDLRKELPNAGHKKKLNAEHELASELLNGGDSSGVSSLVTGVESAHAPYGSQESQWNSCIAVSADESEIVVRKTETVAAGTLVSNQQTSYVPQAWKPAPGLKPKSLLEIQQEEELKALRETVLPEVASSNTPASAPISTPWTGLIANTENKSARDSLQGSSVGNVSGSSGINSKSKKSQLHGMLEEEVPSKYEETSKESSACSKLLSLTNPSPASSQAETPAVSCDDFIEAKDTRKNRKKASKSKGIGTKSPSPVGSADHSSSHAINEKGKITRQMQQEKESLPVLSTGPSFADFVPWKGEQANPTPSPAWTVDSVKVQRPTSLREILREEEKVAIPVRPQVPTPVPSKGQSTHPSHGTSWQVTGSSPSDTHASLHGSGHSKSKCEDDPFWGPLEQSKPERKQPASSPVNSGSLGVKGTPSKGASGSANRQRSLGSRPTEQALSSANSFLLLSKGKADSSTKKSEAMDFREWCESEWIRLTGTTDISFLEFCIKQSTSEAEMLLRENLGSLDRNHEFIDKFLNYKDFLSSDVMEIAFQSKRTGTNDHHMLGNSNVAANRNTVGTEDEPIALGKGVTGKKKGKKGQKVSLSALGFNVVSNRIMMGEIQTVED